MLIYTACEQAVKRFSPELLEIPEDFCPVTDSIRDAHPILLRNIDHIERTLGISGIDFLKAIDNCHNTYDRVNQAMKLAMENGLAEMELANVSSILGSLLVKEIATASKHLQVNTPNAYPDLVSETQLPSIEVKMALETNLPKGHHAKSGVYMIARYVLTTACGRYLKGKENRGCTATLWEIKLGHLDVSDFNSSSTENDSGKTAPIKAQSLNQLPLVYLNPRVIPYAIKNTTLYPGFN